MTTYKIYYKEIGAKNHGIWSSQGTFYTEVPDQYGRKKQKLQGKISGKLTTKTDTKL